MRALFPTPVAPLDRAMIGLLLLAVVALGLIPAVAPWYVAAAGILAVAAAFLVLRQPLLGILLVAFFLPFERLGAYELGDTTIRISQVLLIITVAAWLIRQGMVRTTRLARNPILLPIAAFFVVNGISLVNSVNPQRSLLVFLFTLFTATLAFILPNLIRHTAQVRRVIVFILVSFVLVSGFGLFQFAGDMLGLPPEATGLRELYTSDVLGFTRIQSTAYEPLYFANFLLIPIALLFAFFLSQRSKLGGAMTLVLFILGMIALVLTVSRGGYLAAAAMLATVGLFYLRRVFRPEMIALFIGAVVIGGWVVIQSLGVGGGLFTLDKFEEHVVNVFYGASFDERVYTIEQARQAWREHPWTGIGVGAFGPWAAPHPQYMPEDGWLIVNNESIEVLAETGIIGLMVYVGIIVMLIIRSLRAIRATKDGYLRAVMVALLAAFIGIIVQYQTFSTLYIMHVWFLIGLMIAVQNIILVREHDRA